MVQGVVRVQGFVGTQGVVRAQAVVSGCRGLYAICDPDACQGRDPEHVAAAVLRSGCAVLQLRCKSSSALDERQTLALARSLARQCDRAGVPFFVNDRVDIAVLSGADGVHLGQDDLPVEAARRFAAAQGRPELAVGLSTHDRAQFVAASQQEALAYVAVGPVWTTTSKRDAEPTLGLEGVRRLVAEIPVPRLPVVAIGGVTLQGAVALRELGVEMVASISAVCGAEDPEAAARRLHLAAGGEAPSRLA